MATTLLGVCTYNVGNAVEKTNLPSNGDYEFPTYVVVVPDLPADTCYVMPDSLFNAISGHTIFKVNRTELNLHDPFLRQLADTVLPMANAKEYMLVGIDLRGAASPEGPYLNNQRLSRGRSKALIDFMSTRLDSVQLSMTQTTNITEDYPRLLWHMEQEGDPDAPRVRQIIERHGLDNPKDIKADLRRVDKGALWSRLLRQYYPRLRSARVVLYFKNINPPKPVYTRVLPPAVPEIQLKAADVALPVIRPRQPVRSRHLLAVSSNLLYDMFYMPNFGWAPMLNAEFEYFPSSGPYTLLIGFTNPYYHRWSKHKFFQIRDYHLEVRRYFNPGPRHLGTYLGLYANAAKYGIGFSATKGWEGEGFGGALKAGYVLPIGDGRWRLDFYAAVGTFITRYDPYVYGNPNTGDVNGDYYYDYVGPIKDFVRRNHRFSWMGPTEVGVSLTFDVLYRRPGGGVSFRPKGGVRP